VIGWSTPRSPLRAPNQSEWRWSRKWKYVGPAYQSQTTHYKLIVSLPTFSGKAHLPTHALHCYVQKYKRNKRQTKLDLEADGVGVRNSVSLEILGKLKSSPSPRPQNKLELLRVMDVNDSKHLHRCSICGPTK
jgi:hypothetical protein